MHLTINTQLLAHDLRLLHKVSPEKSSIAVLSNTLFHAADTLTLSATDLQVGLVTQCRATIEEPGSITIPTKKLLELLEQLPDVPLTIHATANHVRIAAGGFNSRLQTLPAIEFPSLPDTDGEPSTLPSGAMQTMIERTRYAISEKSAQYVLKGALLSLQGEVFALVATDGKRLSIATAACAAGVPSSAVLPEKSLDALVAFCDGQPLTYSMTDRHFFFVNGGRRLIVQRMEGQFPRYERIIPRECDRKVVVERASLAAALRRVGVVSGEHRGIKFVVSAGDLVVSSESAEIGDAQEQMRCAYEGDSFGFALVGDYALDFLNQAVQPSVTIEMKSGSNAVLWTDGPDFVNVIMVMR